MKGTLSPERRAALKAQHRKERDKRVCDRIKTILAYDDGYTYSEIARLLLLDDETVRRHVEDYLKRQKLKPENGGSTSQLSEIASKELKAHLIEKTYLYVKDICAYVKSEYKQSYTVSGMRRWLILNGFCYKKPHGVPAKADAIRQEAFIGFYEKLKAGLGEREVLYFGDSTHPEHQTRLRFGWIKKGIRKALKMTGKQKRVHIIGAINLAGHGVEYKEVDKVNTETVKGFLEQLIAANANAQKIHLILDNAGPHKSKEIQEFLIGKQLEIHYLPPYSPNLNPIERLWKIMHEQVTYNQYYQKFADFTEAIQGFFKNIGAYKRQMQNRITDNFQRLGAT